MVVYYIHSRYIYMSVPISHFMLFPFPICVHMFALCVHVSISTLQIGSSVPFFSRFHINTLIYDTCFSLSDFILYDSLWVHPCLCKETTVSAQFLQYYYHSSFKSKETASEAK